MDHFLNKSIAWKLWSLTNLLLSNELFHVVQGFTRYQNTSRIPKILCTFSKITFAAIQINFLSNKRTWFTLIYPVQTTSYFPHNLIQYNLRPSGTTTHITQNVLEKYKKGCKQQQQQKQNRTKKQNKLKT